MKKLLIVALSALLFGCNGDYTINGKIVHEKYRDLFHSYSDSCKKYAIIVQREQSLNIFDGCGYKLYSHYSNKMDSAYKLLYPNGNPCCDNTPVDTICYPVNN